MKFIKGLFSLIITLFGILFVAIGFSENDSILIGIGVIALIPFLRRRFRRKKKNPVSNKSSSVKKEKPQKKAQSTKPSSKGKVSSKSKNGAKTASDNTYRILIVQNDEILVNMVYVEINKEVCGAFSGNRGGGGLFYVNEDHEVSVSDDYDEFETLLLGDYQDVANIYTNLEGVRSDFEEYDDEGNMIGLSKEGRNFLKRSRSSKDGYIECYSDGASKDYIYDIQYEWNLNFNIE